MNTSKTGYKIGVTEFVVFSILVLVVVGARLLADKPDKPEEPKKRVIVKEQMTLQEEADRLRKDFDSVHIYAVSNRYEVWCTHTVKDKWKDVETAEEAKRVVDEYYLDWARNCRGSKSEGKLVK